MFKKIIFDIAVSAASELEVPPEVLFSSNREEVASARYAIVGAMSEYFSDAQLTVALPVGRKCINKIRNCYRRRLCRWSDRQLLETARSVCAQMLADGAESALTYWLTQCLNKTAAAASQQRRPKNL